MLALRGKILIITVVPLVSLAVGTLWTVNRGVAQRAQTDIREDLRRASAVFENLVAARARSLAVAGEVVVRDPRFFSVLTLPGGPEDPQIRTTVGGVAADFNAVTGSDLFEVYDRDGRQLAVAGRRAGESASSAAAYASLVRGALAGNVVGGVLALDDAHYQVCVTPVSAGGRVVGALLLGAAMGRDLAVQLKEMTRSEVTFVAGESPRGSTLEGGGEREAALAALTPLRRQVHSLERGVLLEARGPTHAYLTLVRRIPGTPPDGQQLYVLERALDAETAYLRDIQSHLLLAGIGAVLLAVLAGLLIAQRIVAPVGRLVRGAEEMERGNYDYPIEVTSRDEIGYLAERFNEMRAHQRVYVGSLEEVARLKGEFINIASHELRTPITILRGFHELMHQEVLGPLTPQQQHAIEAMGKSLDGLTRIAEDATRMALIASERLQTRLAECDLAALVHRAVDGALRQADGRSVEVVDRTPADAGSWLLDGPGLELAIGNLVCNGIRFTPDGGRVEVAAVERGGVLIITVEDNGVGIPEERRQRLDQAVPVRDAAHHHSSGNLEFNSAGLGMGLPIARGIVLAHGGSLHIESHVNHGTRVTLQLPAQAAARRARAA